MSPRRVAQIHMDDQVIEDAELEAGLAECEDLAEKKADARTAWKEKKTVIEGRLAEMGLQPEIRYRVGPYVIQRKEREAKKVEVNQSAATTYEWKKAAER